MVDVIPNTGGFTYGQLFTAISKSGIPLKEVKTVNIVDRCDPPIIIVVGTGRQVVSVPTRPQEEL